MEPEWLKVLLAMGAFAALAALLRCSALWRAAFRLTLRLRARLPLSHPLTSTGRPIELIASDARRLGHRFHHPPRGVSFARFEGTRWAYDKVLAEGCHALEIDHLLCVLAPGPDLDAERSRVEGLLYLAGLRIEEAA